MNRLDDHDFGRLRPCPGTTEPPSTTDALTALVSPDGAMDDPPWLTPEQLQDWKSLMAMLMTLPAAIDLQLKRDAGVNAFEYHVLAALSDAPDHSLPLSELAPMARGSLSRLSHAVSRLERDGWVERRACSDGRRTQAFLTEAGWRKIESAAPGHVREARRLVVDAVPPEQLRALGAAARAVVAVAAPSAFQALVAELDGRTLTDRPGGGTSQLRRERLPVVSRPCRRPAPRPPYDG